MSKVMNIRDCKPEDAKALLEIYKPYVEDTAITFEYDVPTLKEFQHRISETQKRFPYLVAEDDGEVLGYAYASPFKDRAAYDWAIETSIYVSLGHHREGIGALLHQHLEERLKAQGILNMNACIAYIDPEDEYLTQGSVRFHEHLGYKLCAHFHKCGYKFGRWYDMVWMEKLIGDHINKK